MVLRAALSQRRCSPLTPLNADSWEHELISSDLISKYQQIPMYIRRGAFAGIPQIDLSFTPPNNPSTELLNTVFNDMIQLEFNKGRYLGPFSKEELELEIGPFQSSPLSLVPKTGKPGKFRLIQNLSHPTSNSPTPSINAHLNSDNFPCTWGTFRTISTLIKNLPPGAQAATRDIAEAYRIIPLHENQWPGVVVRTSNHPSMFALNTSNSFGCTTADGLFGLFGDALADLLRSKGIGPITKWVDDFIFIRIPSVHIPSYNRDRARDRQTVAENGGIIHSRGCLWYKGKYLLEIGHEHFAEDLHFPLSPRLPHHHEQDGFPYNFDNINQLTDPLGIPWESSKDVPFTTTITFAGLTWDLDRKSVSLPDSKKGKYLCAIHDWLRSPTHNLDETRKLYGKLLYTCHVIPRGRAYLTSFEILMALFHDRPFTPRHSPRALADDLSWWINILSQPTLSRPIPGNRLITDVRAYSDASSTTGLGIVIGDRWRAWRLLPGWNQDGRDIGWAEAIAMEFLIHTILKSGSFAGIKVYGDNNGVVEGWWSGRSRNPQTNRIFRRIHETLDANNSVLITRYVHTSLNPADGPSRGIYPPRHLLLPPINIPIELSPLICNFDSPSLLFGRDTPPGLPPLPKPLLPQAEWTRRKEANLDADTHPDS